jgi:hypothetical protein
LLQKSRAETQRGDLLYGFFTEGISPDSADQCGILSQPLGVRGKI